jgi:hypothetical protein
MLLLPNFVYLKDYFRACLGSNCCFYLVPVSRYRFHSPASARLNIKAGARRTSPFPSFWYCWLPDGHLLKRVSRAFDVAKQGLPQPERCVLALSEKYIPLQCMDSNDPLRKKARDRERRAKRKKKPQR